jgi:energy-coupling factor transporter transmembrane protein EcfT
MTNCRTLTGLIADFSFKEAPLSKTPDNSAGKKSLRSSDYACQYLTHDSLVHRLGAGWKIGVSLLLTALAAGARTPSELLVLLIVTLTYYFAARLTPYDLWRDIRLLMMQAIIIICLYCLVHGVPSGFWPGIRISVQIILFYLPSAVFLRTTHSRDMMISMRRFIPYRLSFLVFLCIRFIPFFLRELEEISAAQRLRGARLSPRQLLNPANWHDLFHCLLLPLMVRALKTAGELSRSAEAREFGLHEERTFYVCPVQAEAETSTEKERHGVATVAPQL